MKKKKPNWWSFIKTTIKIIFKYKMSAKDASIMVATGFAIWKSKQPDASKGSVDSNYATTRR